MASYPVRVDAQLELPVSRWLWLVKWLLLIPHFIVLALLWIAVTVVTIIAFFAILITGHYPRPLFDFTLGVLRWNWRVSYYGYAALGTDRYPPFTLAESPDYPATLHIDYPDHHSRGLVLVKWWLLAIPHYLILGFFVGTGVSTVGPYDRIVYTNVGLVGITILVTAIALLFTGRYLPGLYDFLLGMSRWFIRTAAYVLLLTDAYPPFRFDGGGADPTVPAPPPDTTTGGQWAAGPPSNRPPQPAS